MKKKILLLILLVFLIIAHIAPSYADSGWDVDYGGGGSYSSGSDSWSSGGSSYSHDYGSSNSRSRSSSSGSSSIEFIDFLIIMIIVIYFISYLSSLNRKELGNNNQMSSDKIYIDVSDELLKEHGIDKAEFKKMAFEKYVEIQEAWMNFDYNKLEENLTNELFNSYRMQLDTLKSQNRQNIMSNFGCLNIKIIDVIEENGILNVEIYMKVEMYDYVVEGEKVVRGSNKNRVEVQYLITFVKSIKNKVIKCPNCGAESDAVVGDVCTYCRARLIDSPNDYVISKKKSIGQRMK